MPSIGYRGFAVAPITLRAPARRVVITSEINGRAMRAPYRARRCNQRLQMHLTVAMMQPSVANASHSCNFPQRCRGAHRAPADIIQTFDFSPQRPPSSREGDHPQVVEGVGAHCAPADILPTPESPSHKTSLFEGGGPPAGGGRSKRRWWKEFTQTVKGVGARIARPFIPHSPIFSHFRHNSAILC